MKTIKRNDLFGVLALIFGILIIVKPDILAWIIGIYLIVSGILYLTEK